MAIIKIQRRLRDTGAGCVVGINGGRDGSKVPGASEAIDGIGDGVFSEPTDENVGDTGAGPTDDGVGVSSGVSEFGRTTFGLSSGMFDFPFILSRIIVSFSDNHKPLMVYALWAADARKNHLFVPGANPAAG